MENFGIEWRDDDGLFIQYVYWIKNGRFFERLIDGGTPHRARRISEEAYIRAWEQYKNY